MELEHSFTVPVPKSRAWDVLLDVERVAPCMPGATLDSVDGDEIRGRIKVKVGPINMTYAGTARFVERDEELGVVTLEASGKETRGAGTASASVRSVLEDGGHETHVKVLTTLNVTGKPAQFGRGVMNEVGGRLLGIFANNLAATLAQDAEASSAPGGDAGSPASESTAAAGPASAANGAAPGATTPAASSATAAATAIDELKLPARATSSLHKNGITTIGELASKNADELLAIDGIGPASVEDIKAKLTDLGLTLGQAPAPASTAAAPSAAAAVPAQASPAAAAASATAA
ncbi:MAG TPA: SRPBCC domain-containing protein, partial [Streptosporangiaceae bacterium]